MIECPICHVMNEDVAQFCAECGQRFAPPQQPSMQTPPQNWAQPPQQASEAPKKKLHSPLFDAYEEDEPEPPQMDSRKPRGRKGGFEGPESGKPKGLRSPLLGGGEEDDYEEPPQPRSRPQGKSIKGGLRSPLLGGADEDDFEEDFPPSRGGRARGRSQEPPDDDAPGGRPSGKGLRSPLLSGGSDYDEPSTFSPLRRSNRPQPYPEERRSNPAVWDPGAGEGGRPRRLRSALLGGGSDYDEDEYFEEDEEEEIVDPGALRSPLLRAVTVPLQQEGPTHPQAQGPADLFVQPSPPQQKAPFEPPRPQPPAQRAPQQDFNAPQFQGGYAYGEPAPQPPQPTRTSPLSPEVPPPQPQRGADLIPPHARMPEPEPQAQPTTVKSARFSALESSLGSRPSPPATEFESPRSFDRLASDADSFGAKAGAVSPGLIGLVVVPLLFKVFYLINMQQFWGSLPFMLDQVGQIVVMVCLILVILGLSKSR